MRQQVYKSNCFFLLISILLLVACNNPATTDKTTEGDTTAVVTNADTVSLPVYDPKMDLYNTGGDAIQKLHDTLGVKLYVATIKPGDSVALHSHPDHAVYLLQGGKAAITFQGMGRQIMDLKSGQAIIGPPLSDAGKNIGNTTIKMLVADVYGPRGNGASSMPGYDASLDPATFSKVLKDTLNIKIIETSSKPGQSVPLHAHPDHAIYVLQGGKLAFTPKGEATQEVELITGTGWMGGPIIDSAKNIGKTTIKTLEIDFYRPRAK